MKKRTSFGDFEVRLPDGVEKVGAAWKVGMDNCPDVEVGRKREHAD